MYRELPPITETAAELKQHLQHEHHGRKKPRLQMLYLLASGQAHTRQDVARLLGVSRNTVGRWLASYESGGLPALLELYVPAGKAPSLSPAVLANLEQALKQPHGFGSYHELRDWVERTQGVSVKYKPLYTIVRKRFKTKLKVARPSHTKNP
jgi:transposase